MTEEEARKLALGAKVRYRRPLRRIHKTKALGYPTTGKTWAPDEWPQEQREGIVVGLRTLANGRVSYHGYDEPAVFHPEERFLAVMVVSDLRKRPVFVRPEDIEEATP